MSGSGGSSGRKEVNEEFMPITIIDSDGYVWENVASVPMDSKAKYGYYSRGGGIVPITGVVDSAFSAAISYGEGGFEGVRLNRTPYGEGFVELESNIARFVYSSLAFNHSLIRQTEKLLDDPEVEYAEHLQRTPREFFADAAKTLEEDSEVKMNVELFYKNGSSKVVTVPFVLKAMYPDGERKVSLRELQTSMCALAFTNGLITNGDYPENKENIDGGYYRPIFFYGAQGRLKVPTVINIDGKLHDKALFCAIATLPWKGSYLSGAGSGLDVLIASLKKTSESMPWPMKIAGNYVLSAKIANIAAERKFGETIVLNENDEMVEGSAENIIVLFSNKKSGKLRAYFPPLSSNILAGTTRDRMLRVLEHGIEISDQKVEIVMEAPRLDFVMKSLNDKSAWNVSAIILMGTGVGIAHASSLTYDPALGDWMAVNDLRSEEQPEKPIRLRRSEETAIRRYINNAKPHPFVAKIEEAYDRLVIGDNGARITPAYKMDFNALESIFGVGLDELDDNEFLAKVRGGHFEERVNGLKQPEELRSKFRDVEGAITKMYKLSREKRATYISRYAEKIANKK